MVVIRNNVVLQILYLELLCNHSSEMLQQPDHVVIPVVVVVLLNMIIIFLLARRVSLSS